MEPRRPHRLAHALLLLLLCVRLVPSAGPPAAVGPALGRSGTWAVGLLPRAARGNVVRDVAQTIPAARRVLDFVAGSIVFDDRIAACPRGGYSCAHRDRGSPALRWRIHLQRDATADTYPADRFLVLHEIGHAVDGLVLDASDRAAFARAVDASLHGEPCRGRDGEPCAPMVEIFADEFARWAGGFFDSYTAYRTPRLVAAEEMTRIIDRAVARRGRG